MALDADGTICSFDSRIDPRTTEVVRRIEALGVTIVIATGRRWPTAMRVVEPLGAGEYLIQSNGAAVRRIATKEVLHSRYIPKQTGIEVMEVLRSHGVTGVWFDTPGRTPLLYVYGEIAGNPPLELYASANPTAFVPLDSFDSVGDAMVIVAFGQEAAARDAVATIERELSDRVRVILWMSERLGGLIPEILAEGASKGSCLSWLAGELGIPQERVLAIGDDVNDVEMIRWAGTGAAMGNATPATKESADLIIGRIDEGGLADYLESLLDGAK